MRTNVPRLRHLLGFSMLLAAAAAALLALAAPAGATEPFADASYRDSQIVVTAETSQPFADASYREANIALPESVPPLAVDASYREASRVVLPVAATDEGFDWADGLIGAAVVLGIIAAIGAGIAIWWTTTHHGPRHPRGPAVPTH